jgi:putative ABC transport system permease protein
MIAIQLALRDWLDEWPISACLAIGVAAAAIPLLLLLSIRTGIVTQLRSELERMPSSRELITVEQPMIRWAFAERLGRRPDVAFAAPLTRLLSANGVLRRPDGAAVAEVDLVPTGPGDPLSPAAYRPAGLVLSSRAARELDARPGARLQLILSRRNINGVGETQRVTLPVHAILPSEQVSGRRLALIDAPLLLASEIWREDPSVTTLGAALERARREARSRSYAGLRLYGRSIDDVERLRMYLLQAGIQTESRVEEIRLLRQLDRGLGIFLAVIGLVTALGVALSLAAAQWAWVERKRRDLSYLRLIGLGGVSLALIPFWQSVLTTCAGLTLAVGLAWVAHRSINALFAGQLAAVRDVSIFSAADVALTAVVAFAAGGVAALVAGAHVQRITPIAALRGS